MTNSIERERRKKAKMAKIDRFKQPNDHKGKPGTKLQKNTRINIGRKDSTNSKSESRKILETFGTMAIDWAIVRIQDEYSLGELWFPEEVDFWIPYQFALRQQNKYTIYESRETFEYKESEARYTLDMKTDFQFNQKLSDGSVITRTGNISIKDFKVLGASIWGESKSDEQRHPSNDSDDILYFQFLVSIDWLVFIKGCNNMNTISKNDCDDSQNTQPIKFKRNHVLPVTTSLPLSILRTWIRAAEISDSCHSSTTGDFAGAIEMVAVFDESHGEPKFVTVVPESVRKFLGRAGLKMFYMARENGFMSFQDYDKVMARLDNDYHLVHRAVAPRNDEASRDRVPSDDSLVSSSAFLNSDLNSNYSQSNTISAATLRSLRGVQQRILAEAVKLSEIDWNRLKLLVRFDNQAFSASEWALVLEYPAGRKSRGSAHVWLRNMDKRGYIIMRALQSKTGAKRGIRVQITPLGIQIIEAIRTLSPF
jgi:hypothetical protein